MKGQVSTELLVIVAVVLLIFIPILVMVYFKAGEAQTEMSAYQAQLVVFRIAYLANSVGSLGTNTTVFTDIYIPKNINSFTAKNAGTGSEIVLNLQTANGPTEVVEVMKYPLVQNSIPLADSSSYGWRRYEISSVYDKGVAKINIRKVV